MENSRRLLTLAVGAVLGCVLALGMGIASAEPPSATTTTTVPGHP